MTMWLIDADAGAALAQLRARYTPSASDIATFEMSARDAKNITRAGSTMEIAIEGALTAKPDLWAEWFGGGNTTYRSIIDALAVARTDASVRDVVLRVNSPGGTVDGLFDALAAVESFRVDSGKKLSVSASRAQSAAYAIAAMAGPITATNVGATFGSVGVAIDYLRVDGVETVSITNTDSPKKRPNPESVDGHAEIVRQLDALHSLAVDGIARGRGVSARDVSERFGKGASFLAGEAKKRGMIDGVAKSIRLASGGTARSDAATAMEIESMDEKTLRAQHPELYEAVLRAGAEQERDRVVAHLTMGEKVGDMSIASTAIRDGSAMTQTLTAQYITAGMSRADRTQRQRESDAVGAVLDGAAPQPSGRDLGDLLAEHILGKAE